MRPPDITQEDAKLWHVPMERLYQWAREHPGEFPRDYEYVKGAPDRAKTFERIWRDLWYVRTYVSGGDIDDQVALATFFRVSLRDIRDAPRSARKLYEEAEWELCVEVHGRDDPAVNGEVLHVVPAVPPVLVYQFHGLPEHQVESVALVEHDDGKVRPVTFAIFGCELILQGPRPPEDMYDPLSQEVNRQRGFLGLAPLPISTPDDGVGGLLLTREDGKRVTFARSR